MAGENKSTCVLKIKVRQNVLTYSEFIWQITPKFAEEYEEMKRSYNEYQKVYFIFSYYLTM